MSQGSGPIQGPRIQVLPDHVARKIAAGEVIERPQSAVRELLDNALDAGASEITIRLRDGGNTEILIQDNGCGMGPEDLALCPLTHATSKIRTEEDLSRISSLGFRGEALAALAAVSRLEISSNDGNGGHLVRVDAGGKVHVEPSPAVRGTRVMAKNLFYNLPARIQFLKRASTEFSLCQSTIIEKALCFPGVQFRLFHDDEPRLALMACNGPTAQLERLWQCHGKDWGDRRFVHGLEGSGAGFRVRLLYADQSMYRHDRKMIQIFVNQRRINDFGLVQAVEYGYSGYLPGGRFPLAFVWLDVDPERLDVNIHPAKREVKLRDYSEIHHRVVEMLQNHLRMNARKEQQQTYGAPAPAHTEFSFRERSDPPEAPRQSPRVPQHLASTSWSLPPAPLMQVAQAPLPASSPAGTYHYLGQIFGCFLAFTLGDDLYLLDMHAAHERILFEKYLASPSPQPLLMAWQTDPGELGTMWLRREAEQLAALGLSMHETKDGWEMTSCPSWMIDQADVLDGFLKKPFGQAMEAFREVAAQMACRAAVKDGDSLDSSAARAIISQALQLEDPRCPHGRPIWYTLGKDELFTLIGRHV